LESAAAPLREQALSLFSMSIVVALVGAFGLALGELHEDEAAFFYHKNRSDRMKLWRMPNKLNG
jgi:hypothetical protein